MDAWQEATKVVKVEGSKSVLISRYFSDGSIRRGEKAQQTYGNSFREVDTAE